LANSPSHVQHMPINNDKRQTGCVVLIDDDAGISEAISLWLTFEGIAHRCFETAEALESQVSARGHTLYVPLKPELEPTEIIGLIVDLNLPGKNGLALLNQLLAQAPDVCAVLISGMRQTDLNKYGHLPDSVVFLNKPFELAALEAALIEI